MVLALQSSIFWNDQFILNDERPSGINSQLVVRAPITPANHLEPFPATFSPTTRLAT